MKFLEKIDLYTKHNESIYVEIFEYNYGEYEVDTKGRLKCRESLIPESDLSSINNLDDYIILHNNEEYLCLLACQDLVQGDINEDGEVPKYKLQMDFIKLTKSVFKFWYRTEKEPIPTFPRNIKHSKKDEYFYLFVKLCESTTATENDVREQLFNMEYWKNPSAYLAMAKAKAGITTAELKQKPQFRFIDPKNTAIDQTNSN